MTKIQLYRPLYRTFRHTTALVPLQMAIDTKIPTHYPKSPFFPKLDQFLNLGIPRFDKTSKKIIFYDLLQLSSAIDKHLRSNKGSSISERAIFGDKAE